MKLYRNAIILAVIVALLGVAYYFISKNVKPAADPYASAEDTVKLIDYQIDKVSSVAITTPDGDLVIDKDSNGVSWKISSPANLKGDSTKLSDITTNAYSLSAAKVIEENASDLVQYGLDKPVTVTVKNQDGTEKVLEIGSQTPTKDAYYVMMKGSPKVYTAYSYSVGQFLVTYKDVKDKALLAIDPTNIIKISMDRKGQNLFQSAKGETDWTMLAPIEGNVSSDALGPMLQGVAAITASEYEELNCADLSKYGLDKPQYSFAFETSSEKHQLYLGSEKTKGSVIYARFDDSKDVFTLDETPFKSFLDKPLKEILELFAYIVNIDQVTKVEVTMGGKTATLGMDIYKGPDGKSDSDKDKFTLDGKDASGKNSDGKQPARNFFQSLIGIGLDDIDVSDVTMGTPEISIKYYLKAAPGTMQVDFVSKDANYYYVFRNGKYAHIVARKDKGDFGVQGMKDSLKQLQDFLAAK